MDTRAKMVEQVDHPRKRVLFLGYSREQTPLIDALIKAGCEVWHSEHRMDFIAGYDFVVSYGYRHLLKKQLIEDAQCPIINLHIAYLPWNRGAHPNFWSFFDDTPSGVSIHLIDEGVDTGPVIYQRQVSFTPEQNTFLLTYRQLIVEIETLFKENLEAIIEGRYTPTPQTGSGTCHKAADLPKAFSGWEANIEAEIRKLKCQ